MNISSYEYKHRIEAVQKKLTENQLDALVVSEEEDIYYLTGLTYKSLERLFLLIIKPDKVAFLLPQMERAHLSTVRHVDVIKHYWEYPATEPERWEDGLLDLLGKDTAVGVSPKSPHEIAEFLRDQNREPRSSALIEELRWVKSEDEIRLIQRAARYCDRAISQLNRTAYYGMSELEVFSIGKSIQQQVIKETDFDYLSTNILVAAWPGRISHQPHGNPKVEDLLVEGSHISLAFLRVNGYAAELERTFFTAPPCRDQKNAFEIMGKAREESLKILRAGVKCEEVDLAARDVFEKEGLADAMMHRTGHGIGLGSHEGPYLALGDKTVLQENMVVSIEPGIYIEGVGGFRHSDTVRVTRDGYEILTDCPTDIESLTFTKKRLIPWLKGKVIKQMFNI